MILWRSALQLIVGLTICLPGDEQSRQIVMRFTRANSVNLHVSTKERLDGGKKTSRESAAILAFAMDAREKSARPHRIAERIGPRKATDASANSICPNARIALRFFSRRCRSDGGRSGVRLRSRGIRVQACGDCHVANFGGFGTPERQLVFDINDFDETLPAPWEWDVKRLAASIVLAMREAGIGERHCMDAAHASRRILPQTHARICRDDRA